MSCFCYRGLVLYGDLVSYQLMYIKYWNFVYRATQVYAFQMGVVKVHQQPILGMCSTTSYLIVSINISTHIVTGMAQLKVISTHKQ